jgi:hypothetical protein
MGTIKASALWTPGFHTFALADDGRLHGCGSSDPAWPFTKNALQLTPVDQPWL